MAHNRSKPDSLTVAELQRRNELILRSAGEGIYGLDAEGRTTFVNPAGARMLGWDAQELIGQPQHAVIHHAWPDGSPYLRESCPIYLAFKDGQVHRVDDEVFWRKDGSSFPVEYVSTPMRDESGALVGAVVTFRDITERKRQQEALERALAEVKQLEERLHAENAYLRQELDGQADVDAIIGESEAIKKTKLRVAQVATTDAAVLLLGETGVGKELFARSVHGLSHRSERALVKINCAALPSTLIESELFGHEKGAFTGAAARRIGRFELADGGTIFLDEIGELPLELQGKLLRVLQEGELERLGGAETLSVDVRVVAATNRNLAEAVEAGQFRADLYYRLNVFPIEVPALRHRKSDIPLLASHFAAKFSAKLRRSIEPAPDLEDALTAYDWPGNVRELANVIERGVILAVDGVLRVDEALEFRAPEASTPPISRSDAAPGPLTLDAVEREHITSVLEQTGWRIAGVDGAATILGLHPNTLRSRMKKLSIRKRVGAG